MKKKKQSMNKGYLPFGIGGRSCVGMRFALMEAKVILALLLINFRFNLLPGQVPLSLELGVTLSPKNDIKMTIEKRMNT